MLAEPNFGIYGVSADAFFVMGERIWRLDPLHLHVQSGEELMLQIQNHGQEVDSWEVRSYSSTGSGSKQEEFVNNPHFLRVCHL